MPCFHPLDAWIITDHLIPVGAKFRRRVTFSYPWKGLPSTQSYEFQKLPCSQCIGCRLERSRQWAVRCVHEAMLHEKNCFITLTFSPEQLARRGNEWSLDVRDFQLFMKRLRKRFGDGIRFYHCGEYGRMCGTCNLSHFHCKCGVNFVEVLGRPHYHACLFNFDFPDKTLWKVVNDHPLYVSQSLQELWPYGFSTIGSVTFESAAYVARYIMKKINGDMADDHYVRFDTGEVLKPEYTTMSRRPGIANSFIDKYLDDIYPHDFVVMNGRKFKPPRYYDGVLKSERPFTFDDVKFSRENNAKLHVDNCTPERLCVREFVQLESFKLLPRDKEF